MNQLVFTDVSQPQHTPAGRLVRDMFYSGFISAALAFGEYYGYPHNGGMHSLTLKLPAADLAAFLDLVKATFTRNEQGVADFVASAAAQQRVIYR